MNLLLPAGLAALALAVPIVILHMLTPRRPPTPVSSLLHWDGLRHSITAAEPWQKLRLSLLLVLQLLAVVLFALALARPARVEQAVLAEHTVFIVDASGSMAAIDGDPDRLGTAVERVKELREEIPDAGAASLIVASSRPAILVESSSSMDDFDRAAETIRTSAGGVDYESTFALAESLVSPERPTGFVLVSDGQLDETEQKLAPLGTRFEAVGETDTNRAITDLSVTAGPGGLQARVTVESTGGPAAIQVLRLDVDDLTVLSEEIEIPRAGVFEKTYELPTGTRVAAFLDGEDLLAYDNQRYVGAPVLGTLKARVHGESTFFIDQLLSAIPDVDTQVAPGEPVDFEVFVGVPVPTEQGTPFIAVDVPGGVAGVTPAGRIVEPIPTLVAHDPLLEDVDVSRIAIADAQQLTVTTGEVLLGAPGAPLIVRGEILDIPYFYVAFTLEQSNLPVDVAFPIIGARMVGHLTTTDGVADALTVGEAIPVGASGATVTDPRGNSSSVSVGDSAPVADQTGFWVVQPPEGDPFEIAVNPDNGESALSPASTLPEIRPAPSEEESFGSAVISRPLLQWVIAALLVVLAVELWVSYRARGVSSRQWRLGMVLRGAIAMLLVLALINPVFTTRNDDVSTVFVVDVSASVGASVETARAWVQSALTEAEGASWAVVEFGGDARLGTSMGTDPYRPARGVEADSTNVARGLRLGESVLTGSTKQRIVLVSDGRVNSGDLQAELDRLETLGVVVDVHTIGGEHRTDAAVAGIDVPSSVSEGEAFEAAVEILSTISGTVVVELSDEEGATSTETVDVSPGANYVTFEVVAAEPGLQHVTASVLMQGDAVAENNTTSNAVEVKGPPSVLIVEGEDGNGEVLANTLESKGLSTERIPVEELPGLQEISIHQGLVLVDVSMRDLSDEKVAMLATFVKDLGRGLVTVGGTSSYGLGGYRDTPLEALLPIDSEATDIKREVEVAEVLLIDTSESMGACHCAENGGEDMGGPNKTDISKAAAVRAIEALGSGDEVGLLAFSGNSSWVIPLQEFPDRTTIDDGVSSLRPFGETRVVPALETAAEALRRSDKELKHIILFTDGFTSELEFGSDFVGAPFGESLVEAAAALADEGITVSVVGTGEGAIPALEEVAEAGQGRFYPGRDLDEIPEIFVKEARIAARAFINEGEYYPSVTSTSAAVRDLASSPPLLGYVAVSPKPTADIQLQVGEFADPLLASWRVGLGKVTAWMSDGGDKWGAQWAGWDGYADFWSSLVKDTFPLSGSEGQRVEATIANEQMELTLEGAEPWAPGTEPIAHVAYPDGTSDEVRLSRVSDFEFSATVPARHGGTYAVGMSVANPEGETVVLSAIASRSFAAEYLPGPSDDELMESISTSTGGRGEISAAQAFDPEGLAAGVSERTFQWWYLLAAALLWPVDVALRRLRLSRRSIPDLPEPASGLRPTPTRPRAARRR